MRLIDAAALMELARNHIGGTVDCNDIARFPTIEAEPVRHGRWVKTKYGEYVCSLCGEEAPNDGYDSGAKYCYECGAKMDAKE